RHTLRHWRRRIFRRAAIYDTLASFRGAAKRRALNPYSQTLTTHFEIFSSVVVIDSGLLAALGPGMTALITWQARATAPPSRRERPAARRRRTRAAGCETKSSAAWCIDACRASIPPPLASASFPR